MSQNPQVPNGYPPGYPPGYSYPPPNPPYPMPPGAYGYGYHPQPPPYYGHPHYAPSHHPPHPHPHSHSHSHSHSHPQAHTPSIQPIVPSGPAFTAFTPNPEDGAQIETWFQELDKDYDGFIGGAEVVPFFQRSNLHKTTLRELWNLVDYNKNGRLDRKQFIIAIRMLAVLCSPIYAGSNPTVELFNSTISKPISLPAQMLQNTTVASPSVASNTVASQPPNVATAEIFPLSSVQDAPLPPLPPLQQPTPQNQPIASPVGPSMSTSSSVVYPPAQSGYYGNAHYGYPPVATVPATSHQPLDEDDEFSDFNAAPVHSSAPAPSSTVAPVSVTSASVEVDDPWEFVSADNHPPTAVSNKVSSVDITEKNISVMTSTTTTSTTISMLSMDMPDPVPSSPVAPNSPASRVCFMAEMISTEKLAVVEDVEDSEEDFEGFQQASSTTTVHVQQIDAPLVSTFTDNTTRASRLAALDEIIEQDLKLANEEDWEDFEGHQEPMDSQHPQENSSGAAIPSTTVLSAEVLDNPFDMLDSIDTYPTVSSYIPATDVAVPSSSTIHVAPSDDPFAEIAPSSAESINHSLGDVVVDDVQDDEDFGDFASPTIPPFQQSESIPTMTPMLQAEFHSEEKATVVNVEASDISNVVEDDPFAEVEFQIPINEPTSSEDFSLPRSDIQDSAVIDPTIDVVAKPEIDNIDSSAESTQHVELPTTEPVVPTTTMSRQALSLDFLDVDFGPIADSAPLPPLATSITPIDSLATPSQTMSSSNTTTTSKKVDLLDLLDNVYGVSSTSAVPAFGNVNGAPVQQEEEEEDFAPFVSGFTEESSNNATTTVVPTSNISFGDENRDDDDDDFDDFEPFQSTPADAIKSTDVLFSTAPATTSVSTGSVAEFDPFATGHSSGANGPEDDFFADATVPTSTPNVTSMPPYIQTQQQQNTFTFKNGLTVSDLEALVQRLAKKHLYDEAYACAKQASLLRTIASLSEAKNIALEQDDLEVAQSIKQETLLWMQQLASAPMEIHWQRMAQDSKRHGASLDEMYENLTFMDDVLAKKFHKKFLNSPFPSSSSMSDILSADGHSYVRPAANNKAISLEVRMKYHALAKRSARMIIAITSSHRQHVTAWKQCLDVLHGLVVEQSSIWSSTFGKHAKLSGEDKKSLLLAKETRQKFVDPLIAICEMSLWLSATCQESLVHEEDARSLWRLAQPLLLEIDETLQLKNKFAHMSLEDMTIAAGEMSECTGQVVYCNFTLRPLRARYLQSSEAETAAEIVHYPFEKRQENTNISYALPMWNIWHAKLKRPMPSSDGSFM